MAHRREFPTARAKLTQGIVLAVVLAAIGLAVIVWAGQSIAYGWLIGLINLVAAAGIATMAVRGAQDRRPRLVIDDEGIWYRDWNLPKVPWAHIGDAFTAGSRFSPFVRIDLERPDSFLASLSSQDRSKAQSNRLIRPTSLMIPHGSVEADPLEIIDEIRAAAQHRVR